MYQGLGLVAEQVFTRVTGRKVCGWPGRVWLLLTLGFPGAEVTKAWCVKIACEDHSQSADCKCSEQAWERSDRVSADSWRMGKPSFRLGSAT